MGGALAIIKRLVKLGGGCGGVQGALHGCRVVLTWHKETGKASAMAHTQHVLKRAEAQAMGWPGQRMLQVGLAWQLL